MYLINFRLRKEEKRKSGIRSRIKGNMASDHDYVNVITVLVREEVARMFAERNLARVMALMFISQGIKRLMEFSEISPSSKIRYLRTRYVHFHSVHRIQ